jgi:hypothetical protein
MSYRPTGKKPYRAPEPAPFFHVKQLWLAMAWHGLLGEDVAEKARGHIEQWQKYTREAAATGRYYLPQGEVR